MRASVLMTLVLGSLPACTSAAGAGSSDDPGSGPSLDPAPGRYAGRGFVVHEWGTDTIVVGSDGSLQRGLHHEEEDLPSFVYDRIKAGSISGSTSVEVKMETPVTYFYSDTPRSVSVSVGFPRGVFTQWYPAALAFSPFIVGPGATIGAEQYRDPVFDPAFSYGSTYCSAKYGTLADGMLNWGTIDVLPRGATPDLPAAPLDAYTWSYARAVDANPVRISGVPGVVNAPEHEKFLFYRGLGNFELPVAVTAQQGGHVSLQNGYAAAVPTAFVLHVGDGKGAFRALAQGIAPGKSLDADVRSLDGAASADAYADTLAGEVTKALDATGLYRDEAQAMVNTWKRQWFKTPGVRVLYLVPQSWTDSSIPLTIAPKPDAMVRVMMIRVEVITPELETADVAAAAGLALVDSTAAAEAHFMGLGRFAEPRLRRALALLGDPPYGQSFLVAIETADARAAAGE